MRLTLRLVASALTPSGTGGESFKLSRLGHDQWRLRVFDTDTAHFIELRLDERTLYALGSTIAQATTMCDNCGKPALVHGLMAECPDRPGDYFEGHIFP